MDWLLAWAAETLAAAAALWAAWRVRRAHRTLGDARLGRLTLFFLLYALSALVHAGAVLHFETRAEPVAPEGFELQDLLFWIHHALLLASVAFALAATWRPRGAAGAGAMAPVLLAAEAVLRLVAAAGFLYLAVHSLLNHARRTSVASLRVAFGFFALVAGQAVFLLGGEPAPLGARAWLGETLLLAGILVLAVATPGRRMPPG